MDLSSGSPFWVVKNGLLHPYSRLREDVRCDVLVVGAGITGALIADHLARAGMSVCVIESREAGWGSTSASTALLQYEIDTELQDLAERYGEDDAVLAYRSCEKAIGSLQKLAKTLRGVDFQPMQSLYFASRWYHKTRVESEGRLRLANGFELEILDRAALQDRFGINAPAGLLTPVAAETDPYQFAHRLLGRVTRLGGRVHARTALASFQSVRGGVRVETEDGATIRCKQLVFAAGYESQAWLDQRVASNRSSYAFVSEPMPGELGVLKDTLVWESSRPYLYVRRTADERVLVGGEDDKLDIPLRRDARVAKKSAKLARRVQELFPELPLRVAFAWAGTFAETDDGLPFFGTHEEHGPRVHFAMAYGGNGITYSLIGAELLRDTLLGKQHPCGALFSFDRLKRSP
ncbi:MAG: FAD-binding oxidoreductase [Sandaracinaceae bacterium]|jgi:glycine/D-amino acid oxidase-like deaminating enzyme|nr:FAD-binding oxidoreductase [Sandaracinaceae bacterium]MBK7775838.1 FAD-binding oxidoreductase [Sandaracinaceae bacterium]MBK8592722.1 FAD-binding oxidoreductase [Sandaracinaceae bacterium]MBP7681061.1 FAD-binding oxidoreductase [Deltaproteobacteria bacterium]